MTLAVRGIVKLFKIVKREKELYRRILSFSISHDNEAVRIYGHYPIIDRDKATFYRHPIKKFDFTSEKGKEKWTAYKFIKNIYDVWMPDHLKRICSAIDDIPPDLEFGVPLSDSFTSVASADESDLPNYQEIATSAPASQDIAVYKKPRLPPKVVLQQENDILKGQLAQEREQSNQRLMELIERQRQDNTGLKEQIKELINMLKQRTT